MKTVRESSEPRYMARCKELMDHAASFVEIANAQLESLEPPDLELVDASWFVQRCATCAPWAEEACTKAKPALEYLKIRTD